MHKISLATALLLLAGCAGQQVRDYVGTQPRFDFMEYFDGQVRGWGIVQNRGGKVIRRFVVDMSGSGNGDALTIEEDFRYSDGESEQRSWRVRRLDANRYVATAGDIIGEAEGAGYGQAMNWRYVLAVPVGGTTYNLSFDDWMYLQPGGVLINRVAMSKFGIDVGTLTIVFRKL